MSTLPLKVTKLNSTLIDYSIYGTQANYIFYGQTNTKVSYYPSAGVLTDINNDRKYEYVFSIVDYPFNPIPLIAIGDEDGQINLTKTFFPNGAPKTGQTSFIYYQDITGDGKKDIIASEAGLDYPPWTGSKIGVAIWTGKYFTNISNHLPETTSRSYAIGVSDLNGDGKIDILIPAQGSQNINDSYILNYENSNFTVAKNSISNYISNGLNGHTAIQSADFNGDGFTDLLFTGDWSIRNNRIVYFNKNGADTANINTLPAGPLGEKAFEYGQKNPGLPKDIVSGPEVYSIVLDFNNDGKPDVFSLSENTTYYPPGTYTESNTFNNNNIAKEGGYVYGPLTFSALKNIDGVKFSSINNTKFNLGNIYYRNALPFDINADGKMDVIGHFWTLDNPKIYGTTFFINDGLGNFSPVEAIDLFPNLAISRYINQNSNIQDIGWIVPISIENNNLNGLQIITGVNETGLFTIQKFTAFGITNIEIPSSLTEKINVLDRNNTQFINTGTGNDIILQKNNYYSTNTPKSILQISLELISKNIPEKPNIFVKVNGEIVLSPTDINGEYSNLQLINIDLSKYKEIKSIEFYFNGMKSTEKGDHSYAIIRKVTFLGNEVSFNGAIFDNGFAFDSTVAQMNNNGSVKFSNSSLLNANFDISKLAYAYADIVDGGPGIDTSIYSSTASNFSIKRNASGTWTVYKNSEVSDLLTNVERFQFTDKSIAIDLNGNAGNTAKILGAVFGKESLTNKNYVGIGLHFLDAGWTYDNLAGLALDAAGATTNDQIVSLLWTNVIGTKPSEADKASFITLLENGMSAGALAHLAADTSLNTTNINLVGLAQTGIEYMPIT